LSVRTIIIADQIAWCRIPGKRLDDLMRALLRRQMPGHRKPQQPSSTMAHDQKGWDGTLKRIHHALSFPKILFGLDSRAQVESSHHDK
jgi:hypothetical protein